MHKISDKDRKTWKFYVSNLESIKKTEKKTEYYSPNSEVIPKVLKTTYGSIYFQGLSFYLRPFFIMN